jgi:hypothetical protein
VIAKPLDEFGLFHVQASAECADPKAASLVGPTTGQFMTLYRPRKDDGATQFIHSHKLFQHIPIPYSPYTRTTSFTDDYATKSMGEFFFLNPCLSNAKATLNVFDATNGAQVATRSCTISKRGVTRIQLLKSELADSSGQLNFSYAFDRRISHMKPIIFHHHADGVVTCNHT